MAHLFVLMIVRVGVLPRLDGAVVVVAAYLIEPVDPAILDLYQIVRGTTPFHIVGKVIH